LGLYTSPLKKKTTNLRKNTMQKTKLIFNTFEDEAQLLAAEIVFEASVIVGFGRVTVIVTIFDVTEEHTPLVTNAR
jgi:hypothetical protein